jgi:Trk K+ transport system NAD-binding subunit
MRAGGPSGPTANAAPRPAAGLGARLRYRFDNALTRGPFVVIAYLALLSLLVILVAAVVATAASLTFGGGRNESFVESLWQTMLRMIDAGSFAGDEAWSTRLLSLLVTIVGIFLAGSLIGLIANAVDQRVEELRRGRNPVIESGHTLILGWSPHVPRIVGELVIANESERSASIVVLGPADATEMEDEIRSRVGNLRTTKLVCRTGDPSVPSDLERAAVGAARSIVAVRGEAGDAAVVKAVLAVRALDPGHQRAHMVAEVAEPDNAGTLRAVSNGRVLTVSSDDVVAEVTAQACLRSGLASVFTELLDFDGDELYFTTIPAELVDRTYADALLAYESCSVLGVATDVVELNPAADRVLAEGDELIVVAADDSAIAFTGISDVTADSVPVAAPAAPAPVRIVMVGWSGFGAKVLRQLDEFLPSGSHVDVVLDADLVDVSALDGIVMDHATLGIRAGDGGPDQLLGLAADPDPDQVIVLGYRDALGVDDADARTLLALLTLRQAWPRTGPDHVRIVAELLDQRNLVLAAPVGVDDLIVSDALASLLMAQLSERADLQAVFDDLFDAEGAVVDLVGAATLVPPGARPWAEVVAAAGTGTMSAFGYRLGATGDVVVNPPKSAVLDLGAADEIVVVATRE